MSTRFQSFYILLLSFVLVQCNSNRKVISNKKGNSISALVLFPTYSSIDVIEHGDKRVRDDSLSYDAENRIYSNLSKYLPENIDLIKPSFNDRHKETVTNEIIKLIMIIRSPLSIGKPKAPESLIHILDSLQQDNGLFLFHAGFTRTESNQTNQYIRRRNIALASFGFYDTEPNKAYSVMIGLIISRSDKRVSMYKELFWRNKSPSDKYIIQNQVCDIILGYFNEPN